MPALISVAYIYCNHFTLSIRNFVCIHICKLHLFAKCLQTHKMVILCTLTSTTYIHPPFLHKTDVSISTAKLQSIIFSELTSAVYPYLMINTCKSLSCERYTILTISLVYRSYLSSSSLLFFQIVCTIILR